MSSYHEAMTQILYAFLWDDEPPQTLDRIEKNHPTIRADIEQYTEDIYEFETVKDDDTLDVLLPPLLREGHRIDRIFEDDQIERMRAFWAEKRAAWDEAGIKYDRKTT
jgi:hypothetical protein